MSAAGLRREMLFLKTLVRVVHSKESSPRRPPLGMILTSGTPSRQVLKKTNQLSCMSQKKQAFQLALLLPSPSPNSFVFLRQTARCSSAILNLSNFLAPFRSFQIGRAHV